VLVGAGESAEIRTVARPGAGDEETHLILLRVDAQGCEGRYRCHHDYA
jgi:hypothetical protein